MLDIRRFTAAVALLAGAACAGAQSAAPVTTTRVLTRESVIARFADAESKFVDIDGVNLHYKDQGSGPALLLMQGTLGDLGDWDGWAEMLSRRYRVLRFDMPAFGLSGPLASGNYSADRMGSLIDAFMDRMGVERFAIAGISYGGLVAFRYAATRTDRVTALILANSAGIEYGKAPPQVAAAGLPGASAPAPAASGAESRANLFYDAVITYGDIELNLRHMLANPSLATQQRIERKLAFANIQGRLEESLAGRRLYERGDPLRVLAHVRAPALVLWGGANKALNTKTADAFIDALKNACTTQRIVYPDAGHLLIVDKAAQSASDAMAFLDKLPAAGDCRRGR
ncbi:alpha/beta fold hydrolase [Roseateles cellulosilyticus]|uniref:Alpha/beta hydrolase n=1 Tax=Pelomonas cellulosilytica TaxID=2906762 RepID=A0ABS8XM63_9BURK|nr:alpha/beta hydrolase [Pelomonas sp. P8]MCE4552893.1 alpha/beta hydrolase [Pelomonas sp. P8]